MPSFSGMVRTNDDDEACLRLAHAQVENEIPARPRRAPRRGAREYRRLRALPIWGIHIQTKSTFICGINGVGGGGGPALILATSTLPSAGRKSSQTTVAALYSSVCEHHVQIVSPRVCGGGVRSLPMSSRQPSRSYSEVMCGSDLTHEGWRGFA